MIKKKASLAISNVLMEIYEENPELTEETLDTLVSDLLTKGPIALEDFHDKLPNIDETKATILQEQAYRSFIESVPELAHFLQENISSEPVEFMKRAFERFQEKDKEEFDENFVLIYDIGDAGQSSKDENLIEILVLQIIEQKKEKDLLELFLAFRPFLFDLLKRRESFVNFIQALHRLSSNENVAAQNAIKKLEIRDLLVLLVESCSEKSLPKLASWFANQFYPLPLVYLCGKDEYKINFECCLEFLYQVNKPLITSVGTKFCIGLGKSALLSYLFSCKSPINFSTKNGYTHYGSVDLYVSLPSEQQKCIIADVHNLPDSSTFGDIMKKIFTVSQLVLVHITEKDVVEDPVTKEYTINTGFELDKKGKVLYLWRDFRKIKVNTLKKLEKGLENIPNVLGVLPISNLSADQNIDIQNEKLDVFNLISQKINESFENKNFTPLQDLQKALEVQGNQGVLIDQEKQEITELLDRTVNENENKDFISKLFPCFWTDCQIIEERKRRKTIDRITPFKLADDELRDLSKKYDEMQQSIQKLERQKNDVIVGDLTKEIIKIISSNNLQRILLLAETINAWKKNRLGGEGKEFDEDDVSLNTFIDEIMSSYDSTKNKSLEGYKEIKQYLYSNLKRGDPINIVNGKTLKFGSSLLDEIFTEEIEDVSNLFVISIIGAQSSAKSTLLNMLFGCGFSTSAGRCTKGIYISLLSHPSGFRIVVIDTEGLLSVIARDHEFDNLITTMAFSCSHVIIINNKGEINSKLKDLLEICVYAMKHLKLSSMKPKIIFALRDIANNNTEIQQGILLQMKSSLEEAANKFSIDINKMISFSKEDIFLLPSAFQPFEGENKMIVQLNNNLFSSKVLEMRQYIFNYLGQLPKDSALQSLGSFYELTKQLWSGITELGKDIMRARNFLEIELRDAALSEVDIICKKYNELLRVKGQSLLKHETKLLNDAKIVGSTDGFIEYLMKEFMHVKNAAMVELDTAVIKNDKYAEISSYFQEFREMVEYYLRWQNQRFIMDWNSSVLSWKTSKNLSDFKTNLRQEINEKFKASGVVNMQTEVDQIFGKIKANLKKEFEENHKKLHETQIKKLPAEIHKRFEGAQRLKNSDRNSLQVFLPTLSDLIGRITKNTEFMSYDTQGWVKLENIKEFNKKSKDNDAKTIRKEFNSLLSKIDTLITSEPSEDSAFSVITACVSQIKDMEGRGVPVHTVAFMFSCFLEAMFKQYCLKIAAEEAKMKVSHDSFEEILKKEEKYVNELLGDSEDSYNQGLRCGKKWFKEARSKFYEKKAWALHQEILEKIKKEFPSPESANIKAYESSFVIGNYKNVVKYVLGINKFIKEIYHKRIKTLTEEEIQANVEVEYINFLKIINVLIQTLEEWEKENHDKEVSELASFLPFIYKEEFLMEYLPDLYTIKLKNLKVFIEGCIKELDQQKKNADLKGDFNSILTRKLNDSLSAEYEAITGCQERCPLCHNKCIKPNIPHTDHHTNCHLLLAFSGTQHYITEEANLTCCIDPSNYKCKWFKSGKEYQNYDEFINAVHPDWRLDFPTREKLDIRNSNVPEELIEAWVATRNIFVGYYKYKDKTPQKWLSKVPSEKVLGKDLTIEGYINDERKSISKENSVAL